MQTPTRWQLLKWKTEDALLYIPMYTMLLASVVVVNVALFVYDAVEYLFGKVAALRRGK
jgi:hypothetical protein